MDYFIKRKLKKWCTGSFFTIKCIAGYCTGVVDWSLFPWVKESFEYYLTITRLFVTSLNIWKPQIALSASNQIFLNYTIWDFLSKDEYLNKFFGNTAWEKGACFRIWIKIASIKFLYIRERFIITRSKKTELNNINSYEWLNDVPKIKLVKMINQKQTWCRHKLAPEINDKEKPQNLICWLILRTVETS